jgi:quinoprotein glucose dehydrogenase
LHHRRRHHLGDGQRPAELRPGVRIAVVEAGKSIFDAQNRGRYRQRAMEYGEHPWPGDYIEDQQADGIISMTMAVGGLALHWGGACNRFSEEDLRLKSLYGLATDWPIGWQELHLWRSRTAPERRRQPSPPGGSRSQPYPQNTIPAVATANAEGVGRAAASVSPLPMATT